MPILKYQQKDYLINVEQKELALLLDKKGWNPSSILSAIAVIKCPKDNDLPAPGDVIQAIDLARLEGWQTYKISQAIKVPEADIADWLLWRQDALEKTRKALTEGKITADEALMMDVHLIGVTFEQMSRLKWKDVDIKNMQLNIHRGGGEDEEPLTIEG